MLELVKDFFCAILQWATNPNSSNGAILISALIAGIFAFITIKVNRRNSREAATVQIIHSAAWDHDFIAARNTFTKLRESEDGIVSCVNDVNGDDAKHVIKILNHYELVAIGVRAGILSGEIYGRYYRSRFVLDWYAAKGFVEASRTKADTKMNERRGKVIFCEFETLAVKWAKKYKIGPDHI